MLNHHSCIDLTPRLLMPRLFWLRQGQKRGSRPGAKRSPWKRQGLLRHVHASGVGKPVLPMPAAETCFSTLASYSCMDLAPRLSMPGLFWLRQEQKRASRRGARRFPWKRQGLLRHVHASGVGKPVLPMPAAETCFSTRAGYSCMDLTPRLSMPGLFGLRQ